MAEIELKTAEFEDVVANSDIPVLVDFWATWCGPCRMLAPVVAQMAEMYDGRLKVCKVNVDDERSLAMRFFINSIPTLLFFKNGEIVDKLVGFHPKGELINWIEAKL